jgi:hypothetical protein
MKPVTKSNWLSLAGLLLAIPAAYIICISVLKYGLNINGPFDASQPLLESWGIKEPPGWNINLLILLGPIVGFLLSVFQVLKIKWEFSKENLQFHFLIQKKWFPILVAAFSISLLAILFFYLLGENCNC